MRTLPARLLIGAIRLYKALISPLLPPSCRFSPTCSHYAREAIELHGAARGSLLGIRRILRCHPWNAGGYDPVPGSTREHEHQHQFSQHTEVETRTLHG